MCLGRNCFRALILIGTFALPSMADDLPDRCLVKLGTDRFATRSYLQDLTFSPDSRTIAVDECNSPARVVRLFNVQTGEQRQVLAAPSRKPDRATVYHCFGPMEHCSSPVSRCPLVLRNDAVTDDCSLL
ncbi:hypothetical protein Fuma_05552 [Fuerstiella marisgermanici]|uniref:Uncharacterized protein n=1 Tax=Fuerstiella marisgermanici TaxID=1891926 RepID=A0A1P8WPA4_9PLAN|nr:hypothetical protein Fuma_05552 [Fuerstiella marisgermanici]